MVPAKGQFAIILMQSRSCFLLREIEKENTNPETASVSLFLQHEHIDEIMGYASLPTGAFFFFFKGPVFVLHFCGIVSSVFHSFSPFLKQRRRGAQGRHDPWPHWASQAGGGRVLEMLASPVPSWACWRCSGVLTAGTSNSMDELGVGSQGLS